MALIPPFFLDCVVAIGSRSSADQVVWVASGFLYGDFVSSEGDRSSYYVYLVTNRHVFDGEETSVIRFNPVGTDPARELDLALIDSSGDPIWLAHPDGDVDVAVVPINATELEEQGMEFSYFRSHQHVLNREMASDAGISEGDGVYILGFPMGIVGGVRSYVIVRQGSIARIRDWLAGNAKDFLVDGTVFPGNSGGPVVNAPETTAIQGTKSQRSANLLGVVRDYLPYQDSAISMQTRRPRIVFEENSGLASVVPIDYVMEVVAAHRESLGPPPTAVELSVPAEEPATENGPSEVPAPEAKPSRPRRKAKPRTSPSRGRSRRKSRAT